MFRTEGRALEKVHAGEEAACGRSRKKFTGIWGWGKGGGGRPCGEELERGQGKMGPGLSGS